MALTLIISILPVYLISLYIYKKDKNKEPDSLLRKLFIYGMISCIPAAVVEIFLDNLFKIDMTDLTSLFIYIFVSIALVEELFKWLIVYHMTYNNKEFDELYDAIVYAAFVSLGFACFENIFYVLDAGISVGLMRAVTAIPSHASDAVIMGSYLGMTKLCSMNKQHSKYYKYLFLSILMPTLAHAIYDYCIFTQRVFFVLIFVIYVVSLYFFCIKKIKKIANLNVDLYMNNEAFIDRKKM